MLVRLKGGEGEKIDVRGERNVDVFADDVKNYKEDNREKGNAGDKKNKKDSSVATQVSM
tara:strand:- start:228 stop:404 length:177 start_codon:yes stop_codon:yes gene_type:complete